MTFRQRHYVLCWERRFHTWSSYQCRCKRWEWRISDEPHYIKTCVDIRTCSSATSIRWRPSSASGINSSLFTCPKESTTVQILTVCMPFTCDISTKALCLMLRKTPLILEAVSYQCRCRRWEWRISDWPHYIKTCVNISTNSLATSIRWWPSSASRIYSTLFTCLRESSTGQILTVCIWYLPKLQWQWELISMMDPRHVYLNMFNGFCNVLNEAQNETSDDPMLRYGCIQQPIHALILTMTLMYGCAWTLISPHWQSHWNQFVTTCYIGTVINEINDGSKVCTSQHVQWLLQCSERCTN